MATSITIRTFSSADILHHLDALTDILENCIRCGASVSFMLPCEPNNLRAWWRTVAQSVEAKERFLLAALNTDQQLVGTVQLIVFQPENQPHRADVAKLLVHERARRRGVAAQLMAALETLASEQHKTLLVLDTATGSGAETFYQQSGWHKAGVIPDYALMPEGGLTSTTVFYKRL